MGIGQVGRVSRIPDWQAMVGAQLCVARYVVSQIGHTRKVALHRSRVACDYAFHACAGSPGPCALAPAPGILRWLHLHYSMLLVAEPGQHATPSAAF